MLDGDGGLPPAAAVVGSLDPEDWTAIRGLAHRMLDDALDDIAGVAEGPVWRPMPAAVRAGWEAPLPRGATDPALVYARYRASIAPFGVGNRHPRFFGWVHGGSTVIGMLAEMLAGGLNANCGGRDHAPVMVERQVIRWAAEMLGLPLASSGLVVGGTSTANLVAVLVARTAALSARVRKWGVGDSRLVAYASEAAHMCIARALDFAGIGSDALALIPCDAQGRMDPDALSERVVADRRAGLMPLMVVGTAGSVDTGAIDPLDRIASVCREQGVWFHVDGAFGALASLSRRLRPLLAGIEAADSVAFDFHKWAQVPYDAGCIVVRDAAAHRAAFARTADYLRTTDRGLAAGAPWPVDLGPELSRGFRALKVWMTLSVYGADRLGAVMERCVDLARRLALAIDQAEDLDLAAPAGLNVVCFRVRGFDDAGHDGLAAEMQESGACVLSTTTIDGRRVMRAAFVNHRTAEGDVDALLADVRAAARRMKLAQVIWAPGEER
jgi:glutamate/tyrosine decarboxylase-like PLP-dependent enzyme